MQLEASFSVAVAQVIAVAIVIRLELVASLRLLEMSVPRLADPREDMKLLCRFEMGGDELNSVKWYKDGHEFFRYQPTQRPTIRKFPVSGVHLVDGADDCSHSKCLVVLTKLTRAHSGGAYKCEVSSDAPRFKVVFNTTEVSVAVLAKDPPRIDGVANVYSAHDLVTANCSSPPADPPPILTWFINGKEVPAVRAGQIIMTPPNSEGLVSSLRYLRLVAEKKYFTNPGSMMELACNASTPSVPFAESRVTVIRAALANTQALLHNQKLKWPSNAGDILKDNPSLSIYFLSLLLISLVLQ